MTAATTTLGPSVNLPAPMSCDDNAIDYTLAPAYVTTTLPQTTSPAQPLGPTSCNDDADGHLCVYCTITSLGMHIDPL